MKAANKTEQPQRFPSIHFLYHALIALGVSVFAIIGLQLLRPQIFPHNYLKVSLLILTLFSAVFLLTTLIDLANQKNRAKFKKPGIFIFGTVFTLGFAIFTVFQLMTPTPIPNLTPVMLIAVLLSATLLTYLPLIALTSKPSMKAQATTTPTTTSSKNAKNGQETPDPEEKSTPEKKPNKAWDIFKKFISIPIVLVFSVLMGLGAAGGTIVPLKAHIHFIPATLVLLIGTLVWFFAYGEPILERMEQGLEWLKFKLKTRSKHKEKFLKPYISRITSGLISQVRKLASRLSETQASKLINYLFYEKYEKECKQNDANALTKKGEAITKKEKAITKKGEAIKALHEKTFAIQIKFAQVLENIQAPNNPEEDDSPEERVRKAALAKAVKKLLAKKEGTSKAVKTVMGVCTGLAWTIGILNVFLGNPEGCFKAAGESLKYLFGGFGSSPAPRHILHRMLPIIGILTFIAAAISAACLTLNSIRNVFGNMATWCVSKAKLWTDNTEGKGPDKIWKDLSLKERLVTVQKGIIITAAVCVGLSFSVFNYWASFSFLPDFMNMLGISWHAPPLANLLLGIAGCVLTIIAAGALIGDLALEGSGENPWLIFKKAIIIRINALPDKINNEKEEKKKRKLEDELAELQAIDWTVNAKKMAIWSLALVCASATTALLTYLIGYTSTVANLFHLQATPMRVIAFVLAAIVFPCFFMFFKQVISGVFNFIKNFFKPTHDKDILFAVVKNPEESSKLNSNPSKPEPDKAKISEPISNLQALKDFLINTACPGAA